MEEQQCNVCKIPLDRSAASPGGYHIICRPCQACGRKVSKIRRFRIESETREKIRIERPWDCPCLDKLDYDVRMTITTQFAFEMLRMVSVGGFTEPYEFFAHGLFIDVPTFEERLRDEIEYCDNNWHTNGEASCSKKRLDDFAVFFRKLTDPLIKGADE